WRSRSSPAGAWRRRAPRRKRANARRWRNTSRRSAMHSAKYGRRSRRSRARARATTPKARAPRRLARRCGWHACATRTASPARAQREKQRQEMLLRGMRARGVGCERSVVRQSLEIPLFHFLPDPVAEFARIGLRLSGAARPVAQVVGHVARADDKHAFFR